jgi:hypothetical protein
MPQALSDCATHFATSAVISIVPRPRVETWKLL